MTQGRGRNYVTLARQHMHSRLTFGPPVHCKLCKAVWLYNRNRLRGICDKCAAIALNRNDWQILAKGMEHVKWAEWSIDPEDWPGTLTVTFDLDDEQEASVRVGYQELASFAGGVVAWIRTEFELLTGVQKEHANNNLD